MSTEEQKQKWRDYYYKNREERIVKMKEYQNKNRDKIRAYQKQNAKDWARKNSEKIRKSTKEYRKKNPEKLKAWIKVEDKVKIKGLCQKCKKRKAMDRHHPDYSKPLEVMLLCRKCHKEIHNGR